MPKQNAQPSTPAQLRVSAEDRIRRGTAPVTHGWPAGAQALTLLHSLASEPSSASNALKLLHELQVHQIELDLQHEQADQERVQLTQAQAGYVALFEFAPFGYLSVTPNGQVLQANRLAWAWSGLVHKASTVRHVDDFVALESRQSVHDALKRLYEGSQREAFAVQSRTDGGRLQAHATTSPGEQHVLMAFMPIDTTPWQ